MLFSVFPSKWISTSAKDMPKIIKDCITSVSFRGLKFKQRKCEYGAINEHDSRREGSEYTAWAIGREHHAKSKVDRGQTQV